MRKKHKHKWKYQINVKKKILVLLVLGVSLFVGLGYAIIGSDLGIFGTLEVSSFDRTLYRAIVKEKNKGYGALYTGSHQDSMDPSKSTEDIYHFYADTSTKGTEILNKNNVVFAGMCWQMIRTTDTGGVRMLYNGDPEITYNNGEIQYNCGSSRGKYRISEISTELNLSGTYLYAKNYRETNSSSNPLELVDDPDDPDDTYTVTINSSNAAEQIAYIAENYPYTCKNTTGNCRKDFFDILYRVGDYTSSTKANVYPVTTIDNIGEIAFNSANNSPAYVGYMYGDVYEYKKFNSRATQTFTNSRKWFSIQTQYVSNTTFGIDNNCYYASSIEWNNETNPNKYTLISPTQVDDTTDYSTLAGNYIIRNATNAATVYYIMGMQNSTSAWVKPLSSGNTDVSISFSDSLNSSFDTLESPTTVSLKDYYTNYSNYAGKYTCGDSSTTCASPKYITSTGVRTYDYLSGKFTIAKSKNGLNLVDYTTITYGQWYNGYNTTYADYEYTCGNTDTVCTSDTIQYILAPGYRYYDYVIVYDITISKNRDGLNLQDYITVGTDQWAKGYNTTYNDYKYTCGNTDTVCQPADLKYIVTKYEKSFQYKLNYNFGSSVKYEDDKYVLQDVQGIEALDDFDLLSTHHYFCPDIGATKCAKVGYYYYYQSTDKNYYILLEDPNVTTVGTALNNMHKKNTTESTMKKNLENWYEKRLKDTSYESKIDDTIYCNNRTYDTTSGYTFNESGWNDNGGSVKKQLYFKEYNPTKDLSCSNVTDRFSVANNDAKLKYPIALLSTPELNLLNQLSARTSAGYAALLSPSNVFTYSADDTWSCMRGLSSNGNLSNGYGNSIANGTSTNQKLFARPAISLVKGTKYTRGNGSMTDPYVVDSDVRMNKWIQTQLSGTTVTSSSATTTISTIGSTTNGNDLSAIEYYTTCSSGIATGSLNDPETATIRNNSAATITLNACPGAVLHYRIKDTLGNYSDGWNVINDIAQYMLYAQVYNEMTYAGGVASNNEKNLTFWVNNNNYSNTAHRLISMAYYDEDSEATVEDLDTTTLVERAYPTFLGREADSTKTTWINAIDGGSETIESFFLSFINSTEAKNIRGAWGLDTTEYHP